MFMVMICFIMTAGCNKQGYINPAQINTNSDKEGYVNPAQTNTNSDKVGFNTVGACLVCSAIATAVTLIIVHKVYDANYSQLQFQLNAVTNSANHYRNCMHRADETSQHLYAFILYLEDTVRDLCTKLDAQR